MAPGMTDERKELRDALKRAAAAVTRAGIPFALGGSYALWVHGAPEPTHDADLVLMPEHADDARRALAEAGFAVENVPEEWLFKAHSGSATIDVLHRLNGVPVRVETIATADRQQVLAVTMPVLAATDVMITSLRAMDEHYCDFATLLPGIRAVREQLDWERLAAAVADNDFAVAFLVLVTRLGIAPRSLAAPVGPDARPTALGTRYSSQHG